MKRASGIAGWLGVVLFAAAHSTLGIGCNSGPDQTAFERSGTSQAALTTCATLAAAGDAMLSNPPMGQNFGALPIMRVGGKDESVVRFDLGSIPSAAAISSATLTLYVSGSGSDAPVNVHRATAAWDEGTVTYASFAQHFDATVLGSILVTSPNVLKSIDLTPLVTSWVTGGHSNFGVFLETSSNKKTVVVSREGGSAEQKPALRVCYTVPDNHCSPNPCENGTCENGPAEYTCHCATGYTGSRCETLINNCASSPCQNGAACTNGANSYACTCPAGFTGTNCETNVDDCAAQPCQNGGVCQDGIDRYTCQCAPGYAGASCRTLIDNCASNPCQNGSACTNRTDSYACACPPGYSGTNCEINIDDCASQPCHNSGTCLDGVNAYTCSCPPDWGGATCDVNLSTCSQHPCLNGSSCTNGFGNYTCACAPGFSGTNCDIDINDCLPNRCENAGACVDRVNGYSCQCAAGYSGMNCETNVDDCASSPCQNGGSCTDGVDSYSCQCAAGYSGTNCEIDPCLAQGPFLQTCDARCVSVRDDTSNCGSCGHRCAYGAGCFGGACLCFNGGLECNGRCVDAKTDRNNCGACGAQCTTLCTSGACGQVVAVASGASGSSSGFHVCALLNDHSLRCWGRNDSGQVNGYAGYFNIESPQTVRYDVRQVSAGIMSTCVVSLDGTVKCWGGALTSDNSGIGPSYMKLTGLADVAEVAVGNIFACARLGDGSVKCWGQNGLVVNSIVPVTVSGISDAVELTADEDHACARLGNGTVKCWGSNSGGALGSGSAAASSSTPELVAGLTNVIQLTSGVFKRTCALRADHSIWCWGAAWGYTPVHAEYLDGADQIAFDGMSFCGAMPNGAVSCGPACFNCSWSTVPGLAGVAGVTLGAATYVRLSDGSLQAWGSNQFGQLGNGTTVSRQFPGPVLW